MIQRKHKNHEAVVVEAPVRVPGWRIAVRILGSVLLLVRLALLVAGFMGYRLLIGSLEQGTLLFLLDALILLCAVFSLHLKKKLLYWLIGAAVGILLLIYGANVDAYSRDRSYISYQSPAEENILVLEADSSMFSGRVRFYERANALFLRDTGKGLRLDDGFQAFFSKPFLVDWPEENRAYVTGWVDGQEKVWEIRFS